MHRSLVSSWTKKLCQPDHFLKTFAASVSYGGQRGVVVISEKNAGALNKALLQQKFIARYLSESCYYIDINRVHECNKYCSVV